MNIQQILLGGLFLFGFSFLSAQSKTLQKANELYKQTRFSEAAELYEEALTQKQNLSAKTKLANCYRMNNRLDKAEQLYAEIVEEPRAKSDAYFYYGEVLMSKGKYDDAKIWFLKYAKLEPDDERGILMATACEKVKTIEPMFQFLRVEAWAQNSTADDSTPAIFGNAIVFSSDRKIGPKLMKEKSGWTGRDYLNLYQSKRDENGKWQSAKPFSAKLNELNKNTGNPSFTKDGSEIYFTRNAIEPSKRDVYNMQIFSAENGGGNRWKNVKTLDFCSPELNYMHPAITPDGKFLVFVTDRKGGQGGTDLWQSKRMKEGWGRPKNLGEIVNTATNEGFPYFDQKGRLFFCSKGHVGYGGFDVFMTERDVDGNWQKPVNLGRPINSPQDDISIYLNADGKNGMFTSNRHGGDDDIYLFEIVDTKEEAIFVDFKVEKPNLETVEQKVSKPKKIKTEPTKPSEIPTKKKSEKKKKESSKKTEKESNQSNQQIQDLTTSIDNSKKEVKTNVSPTEEKYVYSVELQSFSDKLTADDLELGGRFKLENAIFDYQVYQLTPQIVKDLNELAILLKSNYTLKIELATHTDSYGDSLENLRLSQNRATQAAVYLLSVGVSGHQVVAKGYGEKRLINHCVDGVECSMEEHLVNQRMEVVVLEK